MYVYGPYALVQSAVVVLSDMGYVVRLTNCNAPIDSSQVTVYNIMDIIRMFRENRATLQGSDIFLEVVV